MQLRRIASFPLMALCLCSRFTPAFAGSGTLDDYGEKISLIAFVVFVPVVGIVILLALIIRST